MHSSIKLFSGSANKPLAQAVAKKLKTPLEKIEVSRFSDGEIRIELLNVVRGSSAYVIQSTCAPVNESVMELVLMVDALRRASVQRIVAVIPYFGYARQDRRPGYSRVPISARVIADLVQAVGVDQIITVDLHAMQISGFFKVPVDNISATQLFVGDAWGRYADENPIVVSPDVGGVARARHVAKLFNNSELAIVDKRRPKANVSEVMNIIGDVEDKTCVLIDDLVDTAGTLGKAADALMAHGARRVVAYCTHPVLSGKAVENLQKSTIEELIVTDTIPLRDEFKGSKVRVISIAGLLAETISRVTANESISYILD